MPRRNISLPTELDAQARAAGLNVSALAQRAILEELGRHRRMATLDAWLDELDATHGAPSEAAMAEAREWLAAPRTHRAPRRATRKAAG